MSAPPEAGPPAGDAVRHTAAATDTAKSRFAGRLLLAGLALFFALNVIKIGRNWSAIVHVAVPTGATAPPLVLPLLDGGRLDLAAERGHPVVLTFWASWCEPCRAELPILDQIAHQRNEVHAFAVNVEGDRDAAAGMARQLGLRLPVALDDGSGGRDYQVTRIPHMVLIDRAGRVARVLHGLTDEADLTRTIDRLSAR